MNYLYAPWRRDYVIRDKKSACVFCDIVQNPNLDDENFVLYRDEKCFIVMNKYPYTAGHIMVIPLQHIDNIENLDEKVWLHLSKIVKKCVKMLKDEFNADGVNLGMNLGRGAGAGIAEHVHYHVMPRWIGDTNFITTIADTRVFSTDFKKTHKQLKNDIGKYVRNN
ncbi:MAG: HIT domain-containing protein [Epsilonproteobacteria bacterium]|nr:HIT domain-containing protein [Campylobacterota bacterium]